MGSEFTRCLVWLDHSPVALMVVLFVIGAMAGSFAHLVAMRRSMALSGAGPAGTGWAPASRCPQCRTPLRLIEKLPLIGFVVCRGHCRACQMAIPRHYIAVEGITAISVALLGWRLGVSWELVAALFLLTGLLIVSLIDAWHQVLPDDLVYALLWVGLGINCTALMVDLRSAVIGAMAGYGVLWLADRAWQWRTGQRAIGPGDLKLTAALGAWLGWAALPLLLAMAFSSAVVVQHTRVLLRRAHRAEAFALGPYLAGAVFVLLGWGEPLRRWTGG